MNVGEFIKWLGEAGRKDRLGIICVRFRPPGGHAYVTNSVVDMYVGLVLECGGKCAAFASTVEQVAQTFISDHEDSARQPVLVRMGDGRMYHVGARMVSYDGSRAHAPHTVVELYPVE